MTGTVVGERWTRWRPWVIDVALVVGVTLCSVLLGRQVPPNGWRPMDLDGQLLTYAFNGVLVFRRRLPMTVLLVGQACWLGYIAEGFWPVVGTYPTMLAFYTVVVFRGGRMGLAAGAVMAADWIVAGLPPAADSFPTVLAQALATPTILGWFGRHDRQLRERNRQLADLARQLAAEQQARAEHAVTQERLRIARELHDVVAHHLSVMSVQAGLADYVFEADPPTARGALRTIAATSRETLEEMRSLLQVLRLPIGGTAEPPGAPLRPPPGLVRLGELLERVEVAGIQAELRITGEQRPLPPGIELCAYRVIQEALTNVLKHAGATRLLLAVHYGKDELTAQVTDCGGRPESAAGAAGTTGTTGPALPGGGHGLIGMRERVNLYGGELRAGPLATGGFEVRFSLPLSPRSPRSPSSPPSPNDPTPLPPTPLPPPPPPSPPPLTPPLAHPPPAHPPPEAPPPEDPPPIAAAHLPG
ncbi:sensor histidine kinase [Kitasatospora sp. NBC_01287]|uniref:sensor histidine kinase n=1 Tax=Kitasatospora sp. NBC_01287 TaxID=2903573 RepID=UPI00225488CD|nr:sensor histidine kinase [Kitasatospora sp. NBC_01287]MCX4744908.1 sensor histidine kinase [Kitasatospora sp. NBC_01287]